MLRVIRNLDFLPGVASSGKLLNACFKSTSSSNNSKSELKQQIFKPKSSTGADENSADGVEYGVPTRMMASEAFVEAMLAQGVSDMFGIVGSAFMDPLDLFPEAGIRFVSVQHEQNAGHMADGYARATGKHGVCIAQNGPGITNYVTSVAAAYWAHSPVVCITPEGATTTKGLGGFQEADQMEIFNSVTKFQGHVNNPIRMSEITSRCFDIAMNERGPTQLNIPRDYFYHEGDYIINKPLRIEKSAGGPESLESASVLLRNAKNPVILAGGGVVMGGATQSVKELAEYLQAPVCTTYLHNDAFPASHPLWCGPLGYLGHQTAMKTIHNADVVLAIGTRLGPFATLPQYSFDYWPHNAKVIQIEADPRRIGLVKSVTVGVNGDANLATQDILSRLQLHGDAHALTNQNERIAKLNNVREDWEGFLNEMTRDQTNAREGKINPREALHELEIATPKDAMISTDIGNVCSVANSYLRFDQSPSFFAAMSFGNCQYAFPTMMGAKIGRPDRPAIAYVGDGAWGMSFNELLTCVREQIPMIAVVFNNGQWGAEKKNQVLWFGDRYIGVNLDNPWSYAEIAQSMNCEGITCTHKDQVGSALSQAIQNQKEGKTTVLELMFSRELGDPFRRDAMKLPRRHLAKYQNTIQKKESSTGQPVDF